MAWSAAAAAVEQSGLDEETEAALVESYEGAQLAALKTGLLAVARIVLVSFFASGGLPSRTEEPVDDEPADEIAVPSA